MHFTGTRLTVLTGALSVEACSLAAAPLMVSGSIAAPGGAAKLPGRTVLTLALASIGSGWHYTFSRKPITSGEKVMIPSETRLIFRPQGRAPLRSAGY